MTCPTCGTERSAERERMPRTRSGQTTSFTIGGAGFYVTGNARDDGRLGEVFAKFGKEGSTLAGLMDAISILASIGLQYGVPLDIMVEKLVNTRYEPMGMTDDPEIPEASSVMDYVVRRLAFDFMPAEDRIKLGVLTPEEQARALADEAEPPVASWTS
jgi:ribonucleoside-diphosphate reductase alpha chain